jgi:hypothetical protein
MVLVTTVNKTKRKTKWKSNNCSAIELDKSWTKKSKMAASNVEDKNKISIHKLTQVDCKT